MQTAIATVTIGSDLEMPSLTAQAFNQALTYGGKVSDEVLALQGMSGRKYRYFINNLIGALTRPAYLEVGVWAGSTLCSAIYENEVNATAIDNWSEFGGPSDKFFTNLAKFKNTRAKISFLERDFREVNYASLGQHDVYLFDGPHSELDHYNGLALVQPALKDNFVLIIDDWNWHGVRHGTHRAIRDLKLETLWCAEVRTTSDDTATQDVDWHNGYLIAVMSRPTA